jgi:hypothetical protein
MSPFGAATPSRHYHPVTGARFHGARVPDGWCWWREGKGLWVGRASASWRSDCLCGFRDVVFCGITGDAPPLCKAIGCADMLRVGTRWE